MRINELVILVGGRGKRLGKITNRIPKPLVKVDNKPFLDHLLAKLIKYKFKKIYLLCSYKKKKFFDLYHKKKIHYSEIFCIDEGYQKGTGGALYKLKNKIKKNFILINGDTFYDINFTDLINFKLGNKLVKMCLTDKKNSYKNKIFTNLILDKKNNVKLSKKQTKLMNGGIYIFNKKIFDFVLNKNFSLENDLLKNLIFKNKVVGKYYEDRFVDIGSIKKLSFLKQNPNFSKNKAIFLDRDGVINKHDGYILNYKKFKFLPGVKKAIKYINNKNYLTIIITNQSAVGRSWITEKKLHNIHNLMQRELFNYNKSHIDDILFSPYYKYSKIKKYRLFKNDRKPNNGMIIKAVKKWNIDKSSSFFIGDNDTDKQASNKSNINFLFKKNFSLYKQIIKLI